MKFHLLGAMLFAGAIAATAAEHCDTIPGRAIVLSGDASNPGHVQNVAEMYSRMNLAFEDPAAPRFLFLDKKGKVALGIGGYLKAVGMYDFDGAVDNNEFYTNKIPVPLNPAQRQRFGANANRSTIFLKLVTSQTPVGRIIVYLQTDFGGDGGNYGLRLKQAYVSIGHVTLGKARSTFADGPAMAPTIDDQGPSGQVTAKQMLVQYMSGSYSGFRWAAGAELPSVSYTLSHSTESINQRFPDIPAYVQYGWGAKSHVRLSGILRELSYRDTEGAKNHFVTGWGVQFSAIADIVGGLSVFGHYTYGKGIGSYINDLSGEGFDLVPDGNGKLRAPASAGWTAGMQYNFTSSLFATGSYSRAQLYDCGNLGGDTYRYGQYIAANVFYNPWEDFRVGVEYLHGTRLNYDKQSGHANRISAMLQYSF